MGDTTIEDVHILIPELPPRPVSDAGKAEYALGLENGWRLLNLNVLNITGYFVDRLESFKDKYSHKMSDIGLKFEYQKSTDSELGQLVDGGILPRFYHPVHAVVSPPKGSPLEKERSPVLDSKLDDRTLQAYIGLVQRINSTHIDMEIKGVPQQDWKARRAIQNIILDMDSEFSSLIHEVRKKSAQVTQAQEDYVDAGARITTLATISPLSPNEETPRALFYIARSDCVREAVGMFYEDEHMHFDSSITPQERITPQMIEDIDFLEGLQRENSNSPVGLYIVRNPLSYLTSREILSYVEVETGNSWALAREKVQQEQSPMEHISEILRKVERLGKQ